MLSSDTVPARAAFPTERLATRWDDVRSAVGAELSAFLTGATRDLVRVEPAARPLAEVVSAHALTGGKRIRPLMLHYGHVLAGGAGLAAAEVRLAASVEMLHVFALLQDDVIDGSQTRRGVPSGLARLGSSGAILASDLALTWADQLVDETVLPADRAAAVRAQLRVLRLETLAGEFLDACVPEADVAQRRRNVLKTARYTTTRPLMIGSLIGPSPVEPALLQSFGDAIGVCFQLRDDQLDHDGVDGSAAALEDELETGQALLESLEAAPEVAGELRALLEVASRRTT